MSLEKLFKPEKVAVVGASRHEGKTGHEIFDNLLHGFEGEVYPVNPNAEEVEGRKARDEIEEGTDMAVIAVPSKIVPDVIRDCGNKGVDAAVVVSAGFSETGNESLESEVRYIAEENGVRLLGPNVLGLINTENGMNASFASKTPQEGDISFMSQSGAFCTAILDYAEEEGMGFRHFVSLGNKADIEEVDLLEKWREDDTEVVLGYTEGIEKGRKFMEEARKTSLEKPVVMIKSGRTSQGGDAASSHTGSIAGNIDAYRAAFRQTGVVEAESSRELLNFGNALSSQPLPSGKSVAVVTNAGGPGVITSDEISERGLELAELEDETLEELEKVLPDEYSGGNPVDVIGDAGHSRYEKALEKVLGDESVDAVIVLLTPQANTEVDKTAKAIAEVSEDAGKPVLPCFMGASDVESGVKILSEKGLTHFTDPKDPVKVLKAMNDYREFLERDETFREMDIDRDAADEAVEDLESFGNQQDLLEAYNFDLPMTELAEAPQDAMDLAPRIGHPVVMKIDSPDISHKTDIGAVKTGVETREEVKQKFNEIVDSVYAEEPGSEIRGVKIQEQIEGTEVALGMKNDPQFGPMIMVGLGGIYVEALRDVSFGIPPISEEIAEEMIHELRSHEIFEGMRGKEDIVEPVKDAIIKLGELSLDYHSRLESIEINPLIVSDGTAYVSDINVELKED
ncbi:MAG: acetate--CoA ligase family protein [Candidatus Nanosalina sp.]